MPRVISTETADQVDSLSAAGLTQRRIARKVGLCLTTVNRMVNDSWRHSGRTTPEDDNALEVDPASATRCGGCGGLVYIWPCLVCEINEKIGGNAPPPSHHCPSPLLARNRQSETSSAEA